MKMQAVLLVVGELSSAQWGMFTTAQAAARGVSRLHLSRLAEAGQFERLASGVYRDMGSPVGEFDGVLAAWLSTDPQRTAGERLGDGVAGVVVGAATAAFLHGFGDLQPEPYVFLVSGRRQSQRPGIRYRQRALRSQEMTLAAGVPVTTIERTVADLVQEGEDFSLVADVLADAVRRTNVDLDELAVMLAPLAARRGHRKNDGRAVLDHLLIAGGVDAVTQLRRVVNNPEWNKAFADSPAVKRLTESISAGIVKKLDLPTFAHSAGASAVARHAQESMSVRVPDFANIIAEPIRDAIQEHLRVAFAPALEEYRDSMSRLNVDFRALEQLSRLHTGERGEGEENG